MPEAKLAPHVEETVQTVAEVHATHQRSATALDRAAQALTSTLGRSLSVLLLAAAVAVWIGLNLVVHRAGGAAVDPPPFTALELTATLAALLLAALILATQRRDDALAERRAELTLQLALLSEQKSAKIIALIEELRRDLPSVADRIDEVSEAMVQAPDAKSVLDAINSEASPTIRPK